MEKSDLSKKYKAYYTAKTKPELVHVEKAQFLSIRGKGDPSGEDYSLRIQALYSTAYTLKFILKSLGNDFVVAKLEGLWWFDEERFGNPTMDESPLAVPRSEWEYRLLIRMPEFVKENEISTAINTVVSRKNLQLADEVELFEMNEGKCVQMLHKGPFSTEPESLKQILAFCEQNKLSRNGLHHEIYLSDFRKTPSDQLKTILREPVK
jgi:hypothetical protein